MPTSYMCGIQFNVTIFRKGAQVPNKSLDRLNENSLAFRKTGEYLPKSYSILKDHPVVWDVMKDIPGKAIPQVEFIEDVIVFEYASGFGSFQAAQNPMVQEIVEIGAEDIFKDAGAQLVDLAMPMFQYAREEDGIRCIEMATIWKFTFGEMVYGPNGDDLEGNEWELMGLLNMVEEE